jgi:hypothetical protein
MEYYLNSIIAAQVFFSSIAFISLFWLWRIDKWAAVISLIVVVAATWYAFSSLPEALKVFADYEWFRLLLKKISLFEPDLVMSWKSLVAWLSFGIGAIIAWVITIMFLVMMSGTNVVRGTELLTSEQLLKKLRRYKKVKFPALVGQYFIPYDLETRSFVLFGEPGSGKTLFILRLLVSLRKRSDRIVTMDVGGDLYRKLASKGDRLLSVTSEGGEEWSPFSEIESLNDCSTIAHALIPSGLGESRTWNGYARELLTVFIQECWQKKKRTNQDLIHYVKMATNEELKILVNGTSAQRLFEPGSEKMLSNVQSILSQSLSSLDLLEPKAGEHSFSLRKWIKNNSEKGWLWIVYDDISAASTAPLRAAWSEILAKSAISLEPSSERRIWLILDELASNGKIDVLSQALARGRKYGLSLVLGVQNISQMFSLYGRDEALSILGSVGHMVVLRTPDPDTSDYLSRTIGEVEIVREQISRGAKGSTTTQKIRETKRAVMSSEISKLSDLNGYIKFPGVGWSQLNIPIIKLKDSMSINAKPEPLYASSSKQSNSNGPSTLDEI